MHDLLCECLFSLSSSNIHKSFFIELPITILIRCLYGFLTSWDSINNLLKSGARILRTKNLLNNSIDLGHRILLPGLSLLDLITLLNR